jgi:hypothetical protein
MELQQNNNNGFYSLIRKQRDTKSISGSIINFKNVQVSNDDEILLGWADYFKYRSRMMTRYYLDGLTTNTTWMG